MNTSYYVKGNNKLFFIIFIKYYLFKKNKLFLNLLNYRFNYQGIEFNYIEFDEVLKKYESSEFWFLLWFFNDFY